MGILSYFRKRIYGQCTPSIDQIIRSNSIEDQLRDALLKCSTLNEDEVDEYMKYEFEGIVCESVSFDYELEHKGEEIECFYEDGVLKEKILRKHTNQISQETLEKVRRILPLIFH